MIDSKELGEEWNRALDDAGIDGKQTRLYVFDAAKAVGEAGAIWFRPGSDLVVDADFPNADYLPDANAPAHRRLHRIAVWRDVDLPVLGGRMRHELEHALQWERHGQPIYGLYDVVLEVLGHKAAALEGCGGMYVNAIPAEQDANAAAAMYLRNHHAEAVESVQRDVDSRVLACSLVGPEALETLPARMIAFMFQFPGRCDDVAQARDKSFEEVLDTRYQDAGKFWQRLREADARLGCS